MKLSFDLDADLTPLFNWNTKQVFVYLTASYDGKLKSTVKSEVTLWDSIITDKETAHISLKNARSKYSVWDIEEKLAFSKRSNFQIALEHSTVDRNPSLWRDARDV